MVEPADATISTLASSVAGSFVLCMHVVVNTGVVGGVLLLCVWNRGCIFFVGKATELQNKGQCLQARGSAYLGTRAFGGSGTSA